MIIKHFVYCSRCRKPVNLELSVPCPETGRWMHPECADVKVSA